MVCLRLLADPMLHSGVMLTCYGPGKRTVFGSWRSKGEAGLEKLGPISLPRKREREWRLD